MENGSKKSIFWDPISIKKKSTIKFKFKFGPTDLTESNFVQNVAVWPCYFEEKNVS